jgi:hypothetical protein
VELYARVRRAVIVDKMSEREAARQFGLARETVRKMRIPTKEITHSDLMSIKMERRSAGQLYVD